MPETLSRITQQFTDFWQNLDKSQKTRIYIISAVSLLTVVISVLLVTRTNYVPLISNADPKDIAEMKKILDDKQIQNTLQDNGRTIFVSTKDNNKAHVELAVAGYPKGGMTFDDAYKYIKINTTETEKKKIWQQYKKSSLVTQLKMLDNVKDADVELALPETSLFVEKNKDSQRPTAIVRITPKDELTQKQVQGIVMMVSRGVENLNPKDVTVIDNNANILNADTGDDSLDRTSTQYEMMLKKKRDIEKAVLEMFTGQMDSFDTIKVKANPFLDFDKQKTQTNALSKPDGVETGGATISRESVKETLANGAKSGAPGTDTNPGTATSPTYPTSGGDNSSYKKEQLKENLEWNKTLTDMEKALGVMNPERSSMTVALFYGQRVQDDTKLTDEFIQNFKNDVSSATGIPARNISVSRYKTAPAVAEVKPWSEIIKELFNTYGLFAIMLILIVALMIAAIPRRKPLEELEPALEAGDAAQTPAGPRFIVPETSEQIPEIELEERSEVKKQIDKFVSQKPDAVAQLLRNWIAEDWD